MLRMNELALEGVFAREVRPIALIIAVVAAAHEQETTRRD